MSDFETNPVGTLAALNRARARIAELEGALSHYARQDKPDAEQDDVALKAAREIANLPPASVFPGKEVQRQARIQCIVSRALRQLAAEES